MSDLVPLLHDAAAVRVAVLGAVDPAGHLKGADSAALYRRAGAQILSPEVRPVPGFTARGKEVEALEGRCGTRAGGLQSRMNGVRPLATNVAKGPIRQRRGV